MQDVHPLLLSKEMLNRYEPVKMLGYGAFAMVIKAIDKRTRDVVAIKHFTVRGGDKRKYFRELKVILRLNHPNIVACLDICDQEEDSADLVFEFANHGSLAEAIENRVPLQIAEALPIMIQLANGLNHAHGHGILHRDLKPENVLIFETNGKKTYKISDFGIARFIGMHAKAATSIGSPVYMAPEQFYDEYDLKTDIYALGILFYELLHGKVPFEGSPAEVFRGHLEGNVEFEANTDPSVKELILSMVAKKATDRPDSISLVKSLMIIKRDILSSSDIFEAEAAETATGIDAKAEKLSGKSASSLFGEMFSPEEDRAKGTIAPSTPLTVPPTDPRIDTQVGQKTFKKVEDDNNFSLFDSNPAFKVPPALNTPPAEAPRGVSSNNPSTAGVPTAIPSKTVVIKKKDDEPFFSDEAFDDTAVAHVKVTTNLKDLDAKNVVQLGRLSVTKDWSRTVDTASVRLVNIDDGGEMLVVTKKNIHELKTAGGKGRVLYNGSPKVIGVPSRGTLPLVTDGEITFLKDRVLHDQRWEMEKVADHVVIAPNQNALALTFGNTVCYHNATGEQLWAARLDGDATEHFVSFDPEARLMIVSFDSEDQAVHFYDADGAEVAAHWLPGRVVAAGRYRDIAGAWLIAKMKNGYQAFRAGVEGVQSYSKLPISARRLVGGDGWIAGLPEEGGLVVIDPVRGNFATIEVEGEILDYEVSPDQNKLLVLEGRGEILKYVTCFSITLADASHEGRS